MRISKKTVMLSMLMLMLAASSAYAAVTASVSLEGESHTAGAGRYYKGDIKAGYEALSDENIQSIALSVDGKQLDVKEGTGPSEKGNFTIEKSWLSANETKDYRHEGKLIITDEKGDVETETFDFLADTTTPKISFSGIAEGAAFSSDKTLTCEITDGNIENTKSGISITKNGEDIAAPSFEADKDKDKKSLKFTPGEDGKYKVSVSASDIAENKAEKAIVFTKDSAKPEIENIKISGEKKEGAGWYCSDVTVAASAKDSLSGIEKIILYVDGKKLAETGSENLKYTITESWLSDNDTKNGKHEVKITAVDAAGNQVSKTDSFSADTKAPQVKMSGTSDNAVINKAPKIEVTAEDAHADNCTVTLKVYLNGKISDTKTEPGGRLTYTPTDSGRYKIVASAEDAAGNRSEDKELSFILDMVKPYASLSDFTGNKKDGFSWFDGDVNITVKNLDDLSGLKSVKITVNGDVFTNETELSGAETFDKDVTISKEWLAENSSPDGSYKLEVTTRDEAGNENYMYNSFKADAITPEVSLSGIDEGEYTNRTPDITCEVKDNHPELNRIYITVTRDGKAWKSLEKEGEKLTTDCFTKDGRYKVTAYSVDKAGNKAEEKSISFVKDTVAPVVSISGAKAGSYTKGAKSLKVRIKEQNFSGVNTSGSITRVLEKKKETISWGKITPDRTDFTYTKRVSKTGTYTAVISATDAAGNKSAEKKLVFTIDNEAPVVKITGVSDVNGYSARITPSAAYEDPYFESVKVSLKRAGGKDTAGLSVKKSNTNTGGKAAYKDFEKKRKYDGRYTFTVTVTDKAKNSTTKSRTFIVDRFGSVFKLSQSGKDVNRQFVKSINEPIRITEKNPARILETEGMLRLDGKLLNDTAKVKTVAVTDGTGCIYTYDPSMFEKEGVYTIETKSTDVCKNVSRFDEKQSCSFTVDRTAPVITASGIEDRGRYKLQDAKLNLTVVDNAQRYKLTVTSDGKTIYQSRRGEEKAEVTIPPGIGQDITITASDMAGNTSTAEYRSVTVSGSFLVRLFTSILFDVILALAIAALATLIIIKRRKKKGDEKSTPTNEIEE